MKVKTIYGNELYHFGILGQKWGIRRFENEDGTLTEAGKRRYLNSSGQWDQKSTKKYQKDMAKFEKADVKYVKKNESKLYNKAYKQSKSEISQFVRELNRSVSKYTSDGQVSRNYVNAYNQKLAQILNQNASDLETPSGKVVQFVAKRASDGVGVYTAVASKGYDMSKLKNGVYAGTGRIGYKKESVRVSN